MFAYCFIPTLLRIIKGKWDYKKGQKIIIINNIIVWFIFTIIKIEQGILQQSAAVFFYYIINVWIMLKPKEKNLVNQENIKKVQNNYSLSDPNEDYKSTGTYDVYGKDFLKSNDNFANTNITTNQNPISYNNSKKLPQEENSRTLLYLLTGVFGIIALIIVISVCLTLSNNTPNNTIKNNVSDDMYVIEEDGIKVYNASHILVEDIETALEVISKLDKGIDFAYLAQQYSVDVTSNKGGYLGNFYEGEMVEEFETAVSFLDINEYTNSPVKIEYGYHIIIRHKPE